MLVLFGVEALTLGGEHLGVGRAYAYAYVCVCVCVRVGGWVVGGRNIEAGRVE